jgi:hypothetical protein
VRLSGKGLTHSPGPHSAGQAQGPGHLSLFAPTYLPADTASMAPNPTNWTICKIGEEAVRLGTVEATTSGTSRTALRIAMSP